MAEKAAAIVKKKVNNLCNQSRNSSREPLRNTDTREAVEDYYENEIFKT